MTSLRICLLALLFTVSVFQEPSHGAGRSVVFDQGHGQLFYIDQDRPLDMSGLSELFLREGVSVRANMGKLTESVLDEADVLVISGPFAPFAPEEIQAVGAFVRRGGRMAVMLHISQPVAALLGTFSVAVSSSVIHETENVVGGKSTDFTVKALVPHPVNEGLDGFNIYGGWGVGSTGKETKVIAMTGENAWMDLDRDRRYGSGEPVGTISVALAGTVGEGAFVVFGDDAIFQNQFLTGSNLKLGENMVRWLLAESGGK